LEGRINIFSCAHCKFVAAVPAPLLYHDMTLEFCVQYYPFEYIEDTDFVRSLAKQIKRDPELTRKDSESSPTTKFGAMKAAMRRVRRPHVVFDMSELVRYVMFRDRLAAITDSSA